MSDIKLNIIILNWNGWADTINCVNSLQDIDCSVPFKILVIDNNSTDDSVTQIMKHCPNVELIQNKHNLGFGGGCNVGLMHSINDNVDYAWLLNNDTIVNVDSLQELLNQAKADPAAGIVGSVIYFMDKSDKVQAWGGGYIRFWSGSVKHIYDKRDLTKLQFITGASMLIRITALRKVGLFDNDSYFMYWEDADLCFRFAQNGWRLAVAEKSTIKHKESSSFDNQHHLLVRYFNQSAAVFFCKFYRFCFIPTFIGLAGRLAKRLVLKDVSGSKEIMVILYRLLSPPFYLFSDNYHLVVKRKLNKIKYKK